MNKLEKKAYLCVLGVDLMELIENRREDLYPIKMDENGNYIREENGWKLIRESLITDEDNIEREKILLDFERDFENFICNYKL